MTLFPLPVKAEISDQFRTPARVLQFGDGYEQVAANGLNRSIETWDVDVVIADATVSNQFQAFLIEHGQHKTFEWQSPRDDYPQKYRIVGDVGGFSRNGGGSKPVFFTRKLKFKRIGGTVIRPVQNVSIFLESASGFEDEFLQSLTISLGSYNSLEG